MGIKNSDIAGHLKLPPIKLHCSILAEEAIKNAINDYKSKADKNEQKGKTKKDFVIDAEEVKLWVYNNYNEYNTWLGMYVVIYDVYY